MYFPKRWIITKEGELLELGDGENEIWGFTIKGMKDENTPLFEFYRTWKTVDDFLEGDRS